MFRTRSFTTFLKLWLGVAAIAAYLTHTGGTPVNPLAGPGTGPPAGLFAWVIIVLVVLAGVHARWSLLEFGARYPGARAVLALLGAVSVTAVFTALVGRAPWWGAVLMTAVAVGAACGCLWLASMDGRIAIAGTVLVAVAVALTSPAVVRFDTHRSLVAQEHEQAAQQLADMRALHLPIYTLAGVPTYPRVSDGRAVVASSDPSVVVVATARKGAGWTCTPSTGVMCTVIAPGVELKRRQALVGGVRNTTRPAVSVEVIEETVLVTRDPSVDVAILLNPTSVGTSEAKALATARSVTARLRVFDVASATESELFRQLSQTVS